jgi:putative restriction endonuclease
MSSDATWLHRLGHLNLYQAKHGPAPHKPLLLLVILELAERRELPNEILLLTPELAYRFDTYWTVVAHRRTQPPDVRMPFHHLTNDGVWTAFTEAGTKSPHRSITTFVRLNPDFAARMRDAGFREPARRILIATYFEPAERNALYHLVGMTVPSDDEVARDANFEAPEDAAGTAREARFRLDIVPAYDYACALTGYRVTTIGLGTIVDAAHIHQFSDSRNNDPKNGMALCKNAHWLFDVGLWSVDEDYRIIVAGDSFSEDSPDQKPLTEYHGGSLRLPTDPSLWPDPKHLAWHRKHKFLGAA